MHLKQNAMRAVLYNRRTLEGSRILNEGGLVSATKLGRHGQRDGEGYDVKKIGRLLLDC